MTTEPSFSISQTTDDGDGVIIRMAGELDLLAAPQISEIMRGHMVAGRRQTVDLGEVTFIDSSGLAAIVTSAQSEKDRRLVTIVRSRHPQPNNLFKLTAMSTLFTLAPAAGESDATGVPDVQVARPDDVDPAAKV